ncbi:hypothetical protein TNCV_544091 [Trichonephila clavipes]|nr:hypothetical protein TNCV_544091 [Trichonephila clavipes]
MWNVTDWQKVVFSDESRFVLGTDDNHVRVWRCPGERYNSLHTVLRHRRAPTLGDKPKKLQARTRWRHVNIAGQGGSGSVLGEPTPLEQIILVGDNCTILVILF